MGNDPDSRPELPPRLRRALDLVYSIEGVVAARVWQWSGRVAIGVRGGNATLPSSLLRRVESAVAGLREPDETWDFGILEDAALAGQPRSVPLHIC
jgi:hypothetical protein